eukprot:TRINITY_DN2107_c0_g4_i1.p2 TRINITY_DN2107_c0_g4~~TRINITY_DN2107_c0_g4_i1.p2  ORF type:complete len:341 (-),score=53.97 TRINITY_DN2107_c0_g4_i1:53-1075(-)
MNFWDLPSSVNWGIRQPTTETNSLLHTGVTFFVTGCVRETAMLAALTAQFSKIKGMLQHTTKQIQTEITPKYSFYDVWQLNHIKMSVAPRMEVFSFREKANLDGWTLKTDATFGGKTKATMAFDDTTQRGLDQADSKIITSVWKWPTKPQKKASELESFFSLEVEGLKEESQEPVTEEEKASIDTPGSLHFSGNLSLELPSPDVKQSGYACLTSPVWYPPLDLSDFHGIEMRIKTDGRLYVAQIKIHTALEDDLYQALIPPVPPGEWTKVTLLWSDFIYTWRGYEEQLQLPLEPSKIEYMAVLMAERQDGPFSFHIDWLHAVRTPYNRAHNNRALDPVDE